MPTLIILSPWRNGSRSVSKAGRDGSRVPRKGVSGFDSHRHSGFDSRRGHLLKPERIVMSSTIKTLRKMSDTELGSYFFRNAHQHGGLARGCRICLSERTIWADDTLTLRKKFFAAVRKEE